MTRSQVSRQLCIALLTLCLCSHRGSGLRAEAGSNHHYGKDHWTFSICHYRSFSRLFPAWGLNNREVMSSLRVTILPWRPQGAGAACAVLGGKTLGSVRSLWLGPPAGLVESLSKLLWVFGSVCFDTVLHPEWCLAHPGWHMCQMERPTCARWFLRENPRENVLRTCWTKALSLDACISLYSAFWNNMSLTTPMPRTCSFW